MRGRGSIGLKEIRSDTALLLNTLHIKNKKKHKVSEENRAMAL